MNRRAPAAPSSAAAGAEPETCAASTGIRVIVTRPQPQADAWVARLAALGIASRALPLLVIDAPADLRPLRTAWGRLAEFDLVMFVSPSAVERFFAERPTGLAWPVATRAGSTGAGTERALVRSGVVPAHIVSPPAEGGQFDSEALWQQLQRLRDWRGAKALIVRGDGGRDWLAETLRGQGAQVDFVAAYRRSAPVPDAAGRSTLAAALRQPQRHLWLFSSSEAVAHLPALAPGAGWAAAQALATHERIEQAARAIGFGRVDRIAPSPDAVASHIRRSIQLLGP